MPRFVNHPEVDLVANALLVAGPREPVGVTLPPGVHLRCLESPDREAVALLYHQTYLATPHAMTEAEARDEIDRTWAGEYGRLLTTASFGVWVEGRLAGAVLTVQDPPWDDVPRGPFVVDLFVGPTDRRAGLGRAMVQTVLEATRSRVALRVDDDAPGARALYDALGFRPVTGSSARRTSGGVVAAGRRHSLGLRPDGTVVAAGDVGAGECRVQAWEHVVAVAAGNVHAAPNSGRSHSVGLTGGGVLLATGWNQDGQCDVGSWREVVAVAAGWRRTLAVVADGTARAAGRRTEGACDVGSWTGLTAVAAGDWHSVGLRHDGTVVAAGSSSRGQCDVGRWEGVTAVAAGYLHTVGLTDQGRVLVAGDRTASGVDEVAGWQDVVAVSAGSRHTVGVTSDGRVLAAGDTSHGRCDVGAWRDVVQVSAGATHTLALCADGSVLATGDGDHGQCDVTGWRLGGLGGMSRT